MISKGGARSGLGEGVPSNEALDLEDLRKIFDKMSNAAAYHRIILDEEGRPIDYRVLEVNPAFEGHTGLRREEVVGRLITEILPGLREDKFDWIATYGAVALGGGEVRLEQYSEELGRWFGVTAYSPKPLHFVAIFEDITQQKQVQQALAASEDRYRGLVELSPDPVVVLQGDGYSYINQAFTELFGYDESDRRGGLKFLDLVPEDSKGKVRARYEARMAGLTPPRTFRIDLLAKDGTRIPCETSGTLVEFEGRPADLVIIRDISERLRVEKERDRIRDQLDRIQRMEAVGLLAGGIAHDFNNLLTAISGNASLALEDLPTGHPTREGLLEVQAAAQRAARLTGQLLTFARKRSFEPEAVELHRLVEGMSPMLERFLGADIELKLDLQDPQGLIWADPGLIEQALLNLVVNARDAMPKGGVLLIQCSAESASPDQITLRVSDSGSGMSEEVAQHIFEPFFTTKEPGKGTGLGLSMAYGIIQQHGGEISVESVPDVGTTFELKLPRAQGHRAPLEHESQPSTLPVGSETILVVEDDEMVRRGATRILERQGYRVLHAGNGVEALAIAREYEGPIDLVLTDVVMPRMGGIELANHLSRARPGARVLYVSGYAPDVVSRHGLDPQQPPLLRKPYTPASLARSVRQLLDS